MTSRPLPDVLAEIDAAGAGRRIGAFFDLDGTLVTGFTATAHAGDRIRRRQARIGEVLGVAEAAVRYRLGRMQFERLLNRASGYLSGESLSELDELGQHLFTDRIIWRLYPAMREIVRAHQRAGHSVVLSSSALAIHTEPVARFLGISDVICNRFETDADGALTGRIVEPIIWGPRKATAVQQFCTRNDIDPAQSFFYADGDEDIALMSVIGRPRPVNPRPRLAAAADRNGWPVLRVSGISSRTLSSLRHAGGLGVAVVRTVLTR